MFENAIFFSDKLFALFHIIYRQMILKGAPVTYMDSKQSKIQVGTRYIIYGYTAAQQVSC